jgi:hypothetical protein
LLGLARWMVIFDFSITAMIEGWREGERVLGRKKEG